jgi:hypothetical protein
MSKISEVLVAAGQVMVNRWQNIVEPYRAAIAKRAAVRAVENNLRRTVKLLENL